MKDNGGIIDRGGLNIEDMERRRLFLKRFLSLFVFGIFFYPNKEDFLEKE